MTTANSAGAPADKAAEAPIAIVCGGGTLPFTLADILSKRGQRTVLFALRGVADAARVRDYPHHWIALGQFDRFRRLAQRDGCRDVVCVGSLVRPSIWQIAFDLGTLVNLPGLITALRGGDDHLLTAVGRMFAKYGFQVRGIHEVAPEILISAGSLTRRVPNERDHADIALGLDVLQATSPFDIGQAVVVAGSHVVAVEGIEGTDGMLTHLAQMREIGRLRSSIGTGVVVKAPKVGQNRRFDLPAIGPRTVEAAARIGLAGIAVAAGETLAVEIDRVVAEADRAGLFVFGVGSRRA